MKNDAEWLKEQRKLLYEYDVIETIFSDRHYGLWNAYDKTSPDTDDMVLVFEREGYSNQYFKDSEENRNYCMNIIEK
jgi:hypothetical protein